MVFGERSCATIKAAAHSVGSTENNSPLRRKATSPERPSP
jgi:hypothetical protein